MRNEVDVERELDNAMFSLQRDVLMWRLAGKYGFLQEEQRKQCLESLSKLRDLFTELEGFLTERPLDACMSQ